MKKTKRKDRVTFSSALPSEEKKMMSLDQIEEHLVKSVLSSTLALHILRNSRKPTSKLVNELLEIEMDVGQFVGRAMQMHAKSLKALSMGGGLANTLSFITLGQANAHTQPTSSKLPVVNQKSRKSMQKISSPKSQSKK